MAKDYKLIIFDWDGTVMDSIQRIVTVFDHTFQRLGMPLLPALEIKKKIGLPLLTAFHELVPDVDETVYTRMMDTYRDIWRGPTVPLSPPISGVGVLLDELRDKGLRMAVATGKSREGLERESRHYGFEHYFETSRCAGDAAAKPAPDMLLEILEVTGVAAQDTLMIGDSVLDLGMAANAGIDAVGVLTGVSGAEDMAAHKPVQIMADVTGLRAFLALT